MFESLFKICRRNVNFYTTVIQKIKVTTISHIQGAENHKDFYYYNFKSTLRKGDVIFKDTYRIL